MVVEISYKRPLLIVVTLFHLLILQEVSFAYYSLSNASIGFSLTKLMYGSRLRTRVDAVIPPMETNVYPDIDVYFERECDEIGTM